MSKKVDNVSHLRIALREGAEPLCRIHVDKDGFLKAVCGPDDSGHRLKIEIED